MANTILLKRRTSGPATAPTVEMMKGGELAFNELNKVLYYGLSSTAANDDSCVEVIPVAGQGLHVDLTGSTQNILGIKTFSGEIHVPMPTVNTQAANKAYVDAQVAQVVGDTFTSVFKYKGTLNAATGTLPETPATGDLYRITAEGNFAAAVPFTASIGDHVIYNGEAWDKIDNTDPSVVGTTDKIVVEKLGENSYQVNLSTTYSGQTSITTVGVLTSGTWQASIIGLEFGGTGANLAVVSDGTMFKKVGTALVPAIAGTDYVKTNLGTIEGGTF